MWLSKTYNDMLCLAHPRKWYDLIIIILTILLGYDLHWIKCVRIVVTTQLMIMLSLLWVESRACHEVHVVQRNSSYNLLQLLVSPKALILRAYKPETKGNVRPKGKLLFLLGFFWKNNYPKYIYFAFGMGPVWDSTTRQKIRQSNNIVRLAIVWYCEVFGGLWIIY